MISTMSLIQLISSVTMTNMRKCWLRKKVEYSLIQTKSKPEEKSEVRTEVRFELRIEVRI